MNVAGDSWLFRSLPYGTCLVDREGMILDLNPALERLLGWRLSQCRGVPVSHYLEEIVEPEQALAWVVAVGKALSPGQVTFLNMPARLPVRPSPSREVAVVGVAAPWLGSGGQPLGAMILLHDSEQSESVEGARLRFLSMIAHELNSPLNNLAFATHQMGQYLSKDPTPTTRLLHIIHAEVERMQRLLGSLFAPRPDVGQRGVGELEAIALPPILQLVVDNCGLRPQGVPISADVPSELPSVLANPDAVQYALESQVNTLVAYAAPGSRIALRVQVRSQDVLVRVHLHAPGEPTAGQADELTVGTGDCCFCLRLPVVGAGRDEA